MSGVVTRKVSADEADIRLDRWFKRHYPALGHGKLEKLLRTGQIRVDGGRAKAADRLQPEQQIRIPPLSEEETAAPKPPPRRVDPQAIRDLEKRILYKDDWVIALNKPAGLATQGGTGQAIHLDMMLDGLRYGGDRPRLVHRLDKDTSGVLLLARSASAAAKLAACFRDKTTRKLYWALTVGTPRPRQGKIDLPLAKVAVAGGERIMTEGEEGKPAVTLFHTIDHARDKLAWLGLMPLTGRTHQLRAHCLALGCPIVGDVKYGGEVARLDTEGVPNQLHLHARRIEMPHPNGGLLRVVAPPPKHIRDSLKVLGLVDDETADEFPG
ncbi:MAG: RluA family pseudouridine synthase [Alphaproteobacteria bacterium]|jgi:23S rRNA pseudouridine955/2504/2580 synthase|nr:RluA family pseudouridine synthase [Alphaproteobacteria bacterium]